MESINDSSTTKSGSSITAPTQFLETNNERYALRSSMSKSESLRVTPTHIVFARPD